jgi:glutaredoxin
MQKPLILLGTVGCHLCEDAEHILQTLRAPYQYVDIIEEEKLLEAYQTSIPVLLMRTDNGKKTLYWPFNTDMVSLWMRDER